MYTCHYTRNNNNMSSRSYRLQIMLWHQSLKRIILEHFYCSKTKQKKPTDLRVKTWGGGDKRHVIPPC